MTLKTEFRFTLPKGIGISTEAGRKVGGTMRLVTVKDLLDIERDSEVKKGSSIFYLILVSKTVIQLGSEKMVTRKTIEKLNPADFAFLVDFLHTINYQIIKRIPISCPSCNHEYIGAMAQLGEA